MLRADALKPVGSAAPCRNNGALCVSGSEYDATAVEMVMDKGCKTAVGARLFEAGKPINPIETRLMRFIYLKKYSKQAKK